RRAHRAAPPPGRRPPAPTPARRRGGPLGRGRRRLTGPRRRGRASLPPVRGRASGAGRSPPRATPRDLREREGRAPRGADPRPRRRRDVAAVLGDDLAGDEEAEAAARVLGGEEGVEDLLDVLGRDARARVGDRHRTPALAALLLAAGRDLDAAVRAAGLERVQEEVHQYL